MSSARAIAFRKNQLKPACVALSKVALNARSTSEYGQALADPLDNLRKQLLEVGTIDGELASYAFLPLSHVFHGLKSLPLSILNRSLECVRILIVQGWTQSREAGLCKQLLVLLSFIADPSGTAGAKKPDYGDVATTTALRCLSALFGDAKGLVLCLCHDTKEQPLPVLGQAISAALTAVNSASSFEIQVAASETLAHMVDCLKGEPVLRNFFPGVVSGLTKYLQPRAAVRRPAKAIVHSINGLRTIVAACCSDTDTSEDDASRDTKLAAWKAEQAPQLQKALVQVLKLKDNEKEEVLGTLFSLCSDLLIHSRNYIGEVLQLVVDVVLYLSSDDHFYTNPAKLNALETIFSEKSLIDTLLKSLQGWLNALPRIAQSGDPERLTKQLRLVLSAYNLLTRTQGDQNELAKLIVVSIEQASAIALQETSTTSKQAVEVDMQESAVLTLAITKDVGTTFQPIGHTRKGQGKILSVMSEEIQRFSESSLIRDEIASRPPSLESLWAAKVSLQSNSFLETELNEFVDYSLVHSGPASHLAETLYDQALNAIQETGIGSENDWRRQAVALEVIALTAQTQGKAFAPELVDVLFPVLERIGSSEMELREHALTCLNILAESCGADDAGQLIIQNADYLINSVAQRLNGAEISPQTPKVLVMVIHLCGPSLVPYLDDTLTSIFEILDDYHGYYGLVDPLFAVLEAIVNQASAPSSKLVEGPATTHKIETIQRLSISDVEAAIQKLKKNEHLGLDDLRIEADATDAPEADEGDDTKVAITEKKPATPSKSYHMIQSIARLSQHYLTHASPDLRRRLLSLISRASAALARSEDQYLPLINDIWPVVVSRLQDEELLVVQAAMQTLSSLFQCGGDFLLTRMKEAWPSVLAVGQKLKMQADARNKGKGGRGSFSLALQMVDQFVEMLSYLVDSTGMSPEMEDDVFDMLGPYHRYPAAHHLLQQINADALWLIEIQDTDSGIEVMNRGLPKYPGFIFREVTPETPHE